MRALQVLASGALCLGCGSSDLTGSSTERPSQARQTGAVPVSAPALSRSSSAVTQVVLLGSGTPIPEAHRQGPSVAVIAGGEAYLVDAGTGIVRQAQAAFEQGVAGLDPVRLSRVFFTHLHSDHTLGYPDLILTPAIAGRSSPLRALGPPGLQQLTDHLLAAYAPDIALRITEADEEERSGYGVVVTEIGPGLVWEDANVRVRAFKVQHGAVPLSFGYRFDAGDRVIVISGDTTPTTAVIEACDGCDILVHEVYCKAAWDLGGPGWQQYHASHHTSSVEVAQLACKARPKLLVLTHLLTFGAPDQLLLDEVTARYDGRVVIGQDLGVY